MTARLERILTKLAKTHAPHLLNAAEVDYRRLAHQLAGYHLLVITVQIPSIVIESRDTHIQRWVNAYARFYQLLTQALFPSYADLSARYADDQLPPVVVLEGEASPVIQVMSGYVVPYLASRQAQALTSEAELRGLMSIVLEELEAHDLPRERYDLLLTDGVGALRRLLALPLQHVSLTDFDRPVFDAIPQRPESMPVDKAADPVYTLETLNEEADEPQTPTEQMFVVPISVKSKRRPPIPDLPEKDEPR